MVGEVHWGFIGAGKQPSSDRAKQTHERMCRHQYLATTAKECCAFPTMPVVGVDGALTGQLVRDVAGQLCGGFDAWAQANRLFNVPDDAGWRGD
jgi:hypothetical protein